MLPLGGTVLRGNIDLLATPNNDSENAMAPIVIDFKTDRVGSGGVAPLGERYASQRAVYALAASGAGGGGAVRTAHVFLERPDEPVVEVFDEAALAAARASLEGLDRADPRRVVRGHRRALRRALLRLPRGPAPVPAPRVAPEPRRRPAPGPNESSRSSATARS